MKRKMKLCLAVLCTLALLLSVAVLPASAVPASSVETTQTWSFYSDEHTDLHIGNGPKAGNDAGTILINNHDYNSNTQGYGRKNINGGLYSCAKSGTSTAARMIDLVFYKLSADLTPGQEYTFSTGFYSSRFWSSYTIAFRNSTTSPGTVLASTDMVDYFNGADYEKLLTQNSGVLIPDDSSNRLSVTFTATDQMTAGKFIVFGAWKYYSKGDTGQDVYYLKDARLEKNLAVDKWSFEGKGFDDSDVNVISNDYWDNTACKVTRTIENGVYKAVAKSAEDNMWNAPYRIYFRLSEDLIAGNRYTLKLNAYSNLGVTYFKSGSSVFYNSTLYHDSNISVGYKGGHALVPSTAIGTVTNSSAVHLPSTEDGYLTYTFTATGEMVAGGYIGFAAQMADDAKGTFCVKGAELYMEKPAFKTKSLVLAENIGLNFFMDLSNLTAEEKAASYMTFAVSNSETVERADFDSEMVNRYGYYWFTCHLSSMQMAEAVTPTFHYGDGQTMTGAPYSVNDYIDYVVANPGGFDSKVVTLVKALGDYGHYAQIYLGFRNDWVAGTDYTAIGRYRAADYTDYSDYKTALSGDGVTKTIEGTAVTGLGYSLNFDSKTYVNVELRTTDSLIASATVGDMTLFLSSSGKLRTQALPILKLGEPIVIAGRGTSNTNDFTITLSGLSYIRAILNSDSTSDKAKNTVAALYDYYTAARTYAGLS